QVVMIARLLWTKADRGLERARRFSVQALLPAGDAEAGLGIRVLLVLLDRPRQQIHRGIEVALSHSLQPPLTGGCDQRLHLLSPCVLLPVDQTIRRQLSY